MDEWKGVNLGDKTLRLILKYSYPVSQISEISQGCFIFANCILLSFSSMKHLPYLGALLCLLVTTCLSCKSSSPYPGNETNTLHKRESGPFYHGVASGDPSQHEVLIWTRVTPDYRRKEIRSRQNQNLAKRS